jgi:hypothetical protein
MQELKKSIKSISGHIQFSRPHCNQVPADNKLDQISPTELWVLLPERWSCKLYENVTYMQTVTNNKISIVGSLYGPVILHKSPASVHRTVMNASKLL